MSTMIFQRYKPVRQVEPDVDEDEERAVVQNGLRSPMRSEKKENYDFARTLCTVLPMFFLAGYYMGIRRDDGGTVEQSPSFPDGPSPEFTTSSSTTLATKVVTTPATTSSSIALKAEATNLPASTLKLRQQVEQCETDPNQKCFMFSMKDSGLGSQLINMFVNKLYLNRVYGYTTMLVDSVFYEGYRRPDGEPVLTGYFDFDLAVLNYKHEEAYLEPLLPPGFDLDAYDQLDFKARRSHNYRDMVQNHAGNVVVVSHIMFHTQARNWVKTDFRGYKNLYRELVRSMCPHLQFNEVVRQEMLELRHRLYPDLPDDLHNTRSVVFHVRRTDKLILESEAYPSSTYVNQVVQILKGEDAPLEELKICFLATDDLTVHAEMQQAVEAAGLTCRLVYTPPIDSLGSVNPGDTTVRYDTDAGLIFLTEFAVMLEATYFVGTFGSNVGALAAILRGCPGGYDSNNHFANTYGVDRPSWYFR